jgi:hypothetical protein
MNEMDDAHAYEMQCNYGSQTPEVLQNRASFFHGYGTIGLTLGNLNWQKWVSEDYSKNN